MLRMHGIFFFQAEEGIRDGHVTGVHTCALPIYSYLKVLKLSSLKWGSLLPFLKKLSFSTFMLSAVLLIRSEERRVGKGCVSRTSQPDRQEKTQQQADHQGSNKS